MRRATPCVAVAARRTLPVVPRAGTPSTTPTTAAAPIAAARAFTQVMLRPPFKTAIPTVGHNGEAIDRDKLLREYDMLASMLRDCAICDQLHLLEPLPHFDAIRTGDLMVCLPEFTVPVPRYGLEHRQAELGETHRYMRAAGYSAIQQDLLQNDEMVRCSALDTAYIPGALVVAETPRTNTVAIEILSGASGHKAENRLLNVASLRLKGANPAYLSDMMCFCGQNTIAIWDDDNGTRIAKFLAEKATFRAWHFVRVKPGTQMLAYNGNEPKHDIIVSDEDEPSLNALASGGLNPIPVEWSEMRKLNLSMRAVALAAYFEQGGQAGGILNNLNIGRRSEQRIVAPKKKQWGDKGTPLWAQIRDHELPEAVYQPPPRYAPPMHRRSGITPFDAAQAKENQDFYDRERARYGYVDDEAAKQRGASTDADDEDGAPR